MLQGIFEVINIGIYHVVAIEKSYEKSPLIQLHIPLIMKIKMFKKLNFYERMKEIVSNT